jgi:hypothetical protein
MYLLFLSCFNLNPATSLKPILERKTEYELSDFLT